MGRKSRWCILVSGLGWLFLAAKPGYGSGFALYEAGARSSALAGAVVARADDLSAIFYNPAGLVQLPRISDNGLVSRPSFPGLKSSLILAPSPRPT